MKTSGGVPRIRAQSDEEIDRYASHCHSAQLESEYEPRLLQMSEVELSESEASAVLIMAAVTIFYTSLWHIVNCASHDALLLKKVLLTH